MPSIIIIDEMHPSIIPDLQHLGYDVDYQPEITRDQLISVIHQYQGLIVRSKTIIDQELLTAAVNLNFVARAGAGLDNLDESAINRRDIALINAPEGNRDSLAEHVVGMLLCLLHRINSAHRQMLKGQWDREGARGTELGGKTVGIIGCGNMGTAVARRLSSFNCQVLGYDKYSVPENPAFYRPVMLDQLYQYCDIVSLHVPLTSETRRFYDYSFFQRFHKPLILINSARGEIIPLSDLVRLLKERKIAAAGLDVFQREPFHQLSDNEKDTYDFLIENPNVLMTPHVAGWSHESYRRINKVLVEKIGRLKESQFPD